MISRSVILHIGDGVHNTMALEMKPKWFHHGDTLGNGGKLNISI